MPKSPWPPCWFDVTHSERAERGARHRTWNRRANLRLPDGNRQVRRPVNSVFIIYALNERKMSRWHPDQRFWRDKGIVFIPTPLLSHSLIPLWPSILMSSRHLYRLSKTQNDILCVRALNRTEVTLLIQATDYVCLKGDVAFDVLLYASIRSIETVQLSVFYFIS